MDTHRVRRLRWHASAANPAEAFALRKLLRERVDTCEAALGRAFDKAVPAHEVLHVPKLSLDLRFADLETVSDGELAERIEAAVRVALDAVKRPAAMGTSTVPRQADAAASSSSADADSAPALHSPATEARQALRHYLATGLLPWTVAGLAPEPTRRLLADAAVQAAEEVASGAETLDGLLPAPMDARATLGALLRWLPLLPTGLRRRLMAVRSPTCPLAPRTLHAWRQWIDDDAADRMEWQALWLAAPADLSAVQAFVARQHPAAHAPPFLGELRLALAHGSQAQTPTPREDALARRPASMPALPRPASTDDTATAESLLVPLAGLVLLHPWLPRMLAACGVVDVGGKQIAPAELPRACSLLHALACGDSPIAEHQLPLVKLLLGSPPDEPLCAALPALSADDKAEVEALLDAVRGHWSALRGTGVDGLRLSFLQRRGLLTRGDQAWQLRMQAEAFDMLMGMLPWRIEQIRLPWMPELLIVEWPTP
ncbi:contractile injection system tape measure protein [Variovorax sp. KK3]|uniref:contractile injection system tape measure protein n=1 Tax=Variovorax sp. KK3 TaxID=1855728 RepID=UPI00097BEF18|nr:contractile injection system tape measure protein [Variovorax sp. KK3]